MIKAEHIQMLRIILQHVSNEIHAEVQVVGAYRADVCTRGVAQLRNHLVAEGSYMPGPRVQTVHVAFVSEELHSRKKPSADQGRPRRPEKRQRHGRCNAEI